jgi:O-methyltransferase domain
MVLHDWTPEKNMRILEKYLRALPSGGAVIIREQRIPHELNGLLARSSRA